MLRTSTLLLGLFLFTGCSTTLIMHKDYADGELTRKVIIHRGEVLAVRETKGMVIDYLGVKASVDTDSTRGDAASIKAIGDAITAGIIAYGTQGAGPAVNAAVQAALNARPGQATNSPAIK